MLYNISQIGFLPALLIFIIVVLSISFHEFTHALIAHLRGDDTAKVYGRLTLNPVAHFDPIGFLLILFANFGWGKPTPVNSNNLKNPKYDSILVSIAGPLSNLFIAIIAAVIFRIIGTYNIEISVLGTILLYYTVVINVGLAIFNLLPIPPLDGSSLYTELLPDNIKYKLSMSPMGNNYVFIGILILILPIFNGASLISYVISPIIYSVTGFLIGQ